MKGDVEILVMLVNSYIADLSSAISAINAERIVKGNLSISEQARLNELVNRLRYVEHQKDRALHIEADFTSMEKLKVLEHMKEHEPYAVTTIASTKTALEENSFEDTDYDQAIQNCR